MEARINSALELLKSDTNRIMKQLNELKRGNWRCSNSDDCAKYEDLIRSATERVKSVGEVLFCTTTLPTVSEEYEAMVLDSLSKINDAREFISAAKLHRTAVSAAESAKVKKAAKEFQEAAAILEAVEAAVIVEASASSARTLQARVRTCLLFRRIEDVRRAAAILASTRYELRTLARLHNDEECGICLTRFDYHTKMPLTAPCSNMPMCYACCRDYAGKVCLCGIDHFDRKLWRAAV
jgi:hypothetical protein